MNNQRRVAIIGARGIGNYGGFETFVKEVAPLLYQRNIEVYCSCEKDGKISGEDYLGARLKYFPIPPPSNYSLRKVFEVVYDNYFLLSSISYADELVLLGTLGATSVFIPRLFGKRVYVNIDGMEWRRDKFSALEKFILKMTFKVSLIFANKVIVDSRQLLDQIPAGMEGKVRFIAYGVYEQTKVVPTPDIQKKLTELNIAPREYWLVIARLEPENNILMIVDAFRKIKTKHKLVIVGNFTGVEFEQEVKGISKDVVYMGHVYDQVLLNHLRQNCFAYIHGHSVGGTNPSLLEAMVSETVVVAHGNRFNREVLDDKGLFFSSSDELASIVDEVEKDPAKYRNLAVQAKGRVLTHYSWDEIAKAYDDLIRD